MLVTGGAGFIGSHTVDALLADGYEVVVVDNFYSGRFENLPSSSRVKVLMVDVSRYKILKEAAGSVVRKGDLEAIVHLAALVSIDEVRRNPLHAIEVNVLGTANILALAVEYDVERVVYASSVAVYGEPKYIPITEDHPVNPVNLYGLTKLEGEMLLRMWLREYGVKGVALRYFNVYGPRMREGPYAGVVYKFVKALLEGEQPIIYGDGRQTRDFIYVGDVARANLLAVKSRYTGVLNICSGRETSILELYKMLCSIAGYSDCPSPKFMPPRPGDVRRSVGDCRLAEKVLGWKPSVSLEDGLKLTFNYYAKALRRAHP